MERPLVPQRVSQEFYCGECDGYFWVRVNMALEHEVHVECPNCGHEHRRVVKQGMILEDGRYSSGVKEKLMTTKATYHKEPITEKFKKASRWSRRDGVEVTPEQLHRWTEVTQREKEGKYFDDDNN